MTPSPSPRKSVPVEGLGTKLRVLRKDRGLTQADLATSIGIQQSDLCRMENGQYRISLETLVKLLGELDVPVSEFLDEPRAELTRSEAALVRDFRHLSDDSKKEAQHFVRFLRTQSGDRHVTSRPHLASALDHTRTAD